MKVLYSWLREFVPGLDMDPIELGDLFSEMGLECDEARPVDEGFDHMVVARVLELAPHPDADRIQLVQVDDGTGGPLQICCGAFNMSVGDLVPLAAIGATMDNGMEIAKRKMRGEYSNGMLCSAEEIGMSSDDEGIMILGSGDDSGLAAGMPLAEALGLVGEVVFDLDLTPNRPDALSVVGIARDLAAKTGLEFVIPSISVPMEGADATDLASVSISDPELCGRFQLWVLSGVNMGQSPAWMQRRLTLCGMRPISAIVDTSNYVMLEYGHPNHTYDLAKVPNGQLSVRMAAEGEELTTLDGVDRTLTSDDGVIVNSSNEPVGLAGVMGGASTEISETTTDVLLEMAWWNPQRIAMTSKRLGLRSEASLRYDKGVDPEIAQHAALRFGQLLSEQGATLHPGVASAEGNLVAPAAISMTADRVNGLLGSDLSVEQMVSYLTPLGFESTSITDSSFDVQVPTFRPDSTIDVDVIEEIARMHGYENFAKTVPSSPLAGGLSPRQRDVRTLRDILVGEGLAEAAPMPFLAPGDLERCGVRSDGVTVTNPLDSQESILRTSLLPGLVKTLGYNASHRRLGVSLFEIGRCFAADPDGGVPSEWEEVAVVVGGAEAPHAVGIALRTAESLGLLDVIIRNAEVGGLHPARSAEIFAGDTKIGVVGEVDPDVATAFGVTERIAYFSATLGGPAAWHGENGLLSVPRSARWLRPISRFPSSDLDLAFVVPESVPADAVASTLSTVGEGMVVSVELFDVYRGSSLPQGTRSVAYRMRLQSSTGTLTDEQMADMQQKLIAAVEKTHDAKLR